MAPAFALARVEGEPFTEADLQGATSVLVFYPFAFSPTCTEQLRVYEDARPEFERRGATLYGVSCDAVWSQQAFKEQLGVSMEQLSDFEPKGATCRAFDVLHPGGFPQRALVIADPSGEVVWRHVADSPGDLPPVQLILDALDALDAPRATQRGSDGRGSRPAALARDLHPPSASSSRKRRSTRASSSTT